jgi:hypothetical protein
MTKKNEPELARYLRTSIACYTDAKFLTDTCLTDLLNRIAKTFVSDSSLRWWWTALKVPARIVKYDGDGLAELKACAGKALNESVFLIVTDDENQPWIGINIQFGDAVKVISEGPYFEYFLTDQLVDWIVFDTHHNELIFAKTDANDIDDLRDW